jgi:hypothetical protein
MHWQGPDFVLSIIAMSFAAWVVTTWIRARHGYAIEDEWGGKTERSDTVAAERLRVENAALAGRIAQLESRTAAIETIVTDGGYAIARQIESLGEVATITAGKDMVR